MGCAHQNAVWSFVLSLPQSGLRFSSCECTRAFNTLPRVFFRWILPVCRLLASVFLAWILVWAWSSSQQRCTRNYYWRNSLIIRFHSSYGWENRLELCWNSSNNLLWSAKIHCWKDVIVWFRWLMDCYRFVVKVCMDCYRLPFFLGLGWNLYRLIIIANCS